MQDTHPTTYFPWRLRSIIVAIIIETCLTLTVPVTTVDALGHFETG